MFKFFTWLCCLCFLSNLLAQEVIQTENNLGVEDLVKNIFIKGNCRNVSNISAIGNEMLSIGQFENGANVIDINDGIILSTGDIALAQGPNISSEASYSFGAISNDLDLNQLATSTLFDATGIEFDFVPLDDKVTFRYVFASEEYCEFVGSSFNDVFGFFVSGPGINGTYDNNAINVATLIGTDEDVSINTVNHINNVNFYIDNVTNLDAENCMIIANPASEEYIEYDGFTIPLTASFQVIPCETYHIRLVIGDVGDADLDSGVFLETNSFDLGEGINVRAEVPGSREPIAYESCVDGQFVFTRSALSNIKEDFTIDYSISPESEAVNGVDFLEIPLSVTIPAGETSFILPITVIEDNVTEGPEKLKLELVYDCDCIDPTISELIINEANNFSVNFEEIIVCADQAFSIAPEIIGGVPPFDFLWETGVDTEIYQGSVREPTGYTVTITDFCGNSILGIASIDVQDIPTATLMGNYNLCETTSTGIPVLLEGNPPWGIGYSIDGVEQIPIENIQTNPFYLSTPTEGTYVLTAFNDTFCNGTVIGGAVIGSPFALIADIVAPSCSNSSDGTIEITQLDAVTPFSIEWNIEREDDYILENLKEDIYTLSIIDGDDCLYEKIFDLKAASNDINDCVPIYIPNIFSPNNDGINDVFSIFIEPASGIEKIYSLQMYSRWGELIFEQTNFIPENGLTEWKGNYKGRPLNSDIYVYKIIIDFEDGNTLLLNGDITLLR